MDGVNNTLLKTGDIVVLIGIKTEKRTMRLFGTEEDKAPDKIEYDLPMFVIDIYGEKFALKVDETSVELVPVAHIFNEVRYVIRNWHFDPEVGQQLIGKTITGLYATKDYPNTIIGKLRENPINLAAKIVLTVCMGLGVHIPISIEDIDEKFDASLMLQFGSAFYKAVTV